MNNLNNNNKKIQCTQADHINNKNYNQQHKINYISSYNTYNSYNSYLSFIPQQEAIYNSNTQIILDWDDTLFPTAFTEYNIQNGYTLNNNNIINNKLKLIEIESNN